MSAQYAMIIDSSRCIDCRACVAACKVANKVPEGFWRNWVKQSLPVPVAGKRARGHFQPGACMHCEKPSCVTACPTGATYKDASDGIVKIDPKLCIGCGNCIPACPYGARYRDPVRRIADKCNYCPERRAQGLAPACVDTCPTKARVFGDMNDPESEAGRLLRANTNRLVRVVNTKTDTQPHMYYLAATAPLDWPAEAVIRPPMAALIKAVAPGVSALVGLAAVGVAVMAGREFLAGKSKDHEPRDRS